MESLITLIARLVDNAVWSCAAALGVALGIGVVASCGEQLRRYARRGLVFCGLGVCALLFCGKPPAGSTDGMDHVSSPLMVGVPRPSTGPTADDEPKFTAIRVTANGVDLELHRPEALMTEAVEVVLVGSTNLVAATWEPFTNAVFAAGETNVAVRVDRAQLDAHAVSLRSNYSTVGFAHSIGEWDADGAVNFPACYVGGVLPRVQARFSVEPQVSVTARFFAAALGETSPLGGLIDVAVPFENGVSDWVMFTSTRVIETKVAKGATTQNEAASRITEAINSSGKFIYAQGDARYCHEEFLSGEWFLSLTECLSQLRHPDEDGYAVCCIDCAAFVVSFSNLLGCNLYSCQMQEGFDTNPIQVIGETTWRSFSFYCHEVAWTGSCGDSDFVYDACLRVDGDDSPSVPPHQALLPVGMMFSDGDEDEPFVYRERFAKPGSTGYDRCRVNSLTKRRLKIK